ncbi:MAG: putative Adenosylhomocysteine nucleosidase [Nitrospira sp.]|nr:putative Adenosylhomocysteine nucleosidase [Nitrospira sp.]
MSAIGLFAATRWEVQAVRRAFPVSEMRVLGTVRCLFARRPHLDWWIIPTGVGPERAAATARRVIAEQPFAAVWSTGFACALRAASIGDVLIGTQVTAEREPEETRQCDPSMVERAQQDMQHQLVPVQVGPFVSVPHVLYRAEEKRDMAARARAVGLDMESAALGMVAAERKIPFGIIRTVSDLVDEDLPLDFNLFLRPSGWAKGVVSCLAHPTALLGFNRLRGQSRIAGAQLTAVFRALTDQADVGAMV